MLRPATVLLLIGLLALVLLTVFGLVVWASTGYSASAETEEALKKADVDIGDWYAFGADDRRSPSVGVVLYPGGHVSADAYALIAQQLAEESGALVAVTRAPLNLTLLDQDAAADVFEAYPDVERWVVGGHSLGGVAAASFAETVPRADRLLMWANYPSGGTDLSGTELEVTSILAARTGCWIVEASRRLGRGFRPRRSTWRSKVQTTPTSAITERRAAMANRRSLAKKRGRRSSQRAATRSSGCARQGPSLAIVGLQPQPLVLRRQRVDPNSIT